MRIHFIRHASFVLEYGGLWILVDPMLGPEKMKPAIANTPNPRPNPLTPLPLNQDALDRLLQRLDALMITHTHSDHWDETAQEKCPKTLTVFCQPEDAQKIRSAGFDASIPVDSSHSIEQIRIIRTGGQHGRGEIGRLMAPVSGFVLESANEPTLYIAGDTVWCEQVEQAVKQHKPKVIILNTGAAQFLEGGPITMTAQDVAQLCQSAPGAAVVAVHMEAINHCVLTRAELSSHLTSAGLNHQVIIPDDGQQLDF